MNIGAACKASLVVALLALIATFIILKPFEGSIAVLSVAALACAAVIWSVLYAIFKKAQEHE